MKAVSVSEMRCIDALAASRYGISELVLMENAGHETAAVVWEECGRCPARICIVAGYGNNGGDGFAAARHLAAMGCDVRVVFVGSTAKLKESSLINYKILRSMNILLQEFLPEELAELQLTAIADSLAWADCVVDALLGTGVTLPLRDYCKTLIQLINERAAKVVAVDVPSGIDADNGTVDGIAVRAVVTVTFGLLKQGMCFYPAAEFCGRIKIVPIGLPKDLLVNGNIKQNLINNNMVKSIVGRRSGAVHKGSCGRVAVIAGSAGMTGAAALAALAALRIGAGLVTLAVPQSLQSIMAVKLTEVMTLPLPENAGAIQEASVSAMLALSENADVVLIGPGLGRNDSVQAAVREFLQKVQKTVVIDADAIYALNGRTDILRTLAKMPIITPHIGEMAALLGRAASEISSHMIETARQTAESRQAVVVLKSARTVVAYPDGAVYINTKGNAGMATGGSGDVLAGTIAGLLAEKQDSQAAVAGVSIHAVAGDIAAANGMEGLIAGDILAALPKARAHIIS